jgi:alpha-L-rhamnosidase
MQIDENSPGYRNIIFKPQIVSDLEHVKYSNLTPYGTAGIEWKNSGGTLEIAVQVPVGSTAQVYFPQETGKDFKILEGGMEIPSNSELISDMGESGAYRVFSVTSGNYSFKRSKP